jgi:hypothetical protein
MNLGQALRHTGNGCYKWRTDTHHFASVLALELGRMPTMNIVHQPRETDGYRNRTMHALTQREREEVGKRQLDALRGVQEERLSFAEICARARCDFNQTTRHILQGHIDAGLVESCGHGRSTKYWARRGR